MSDVSALASQWASLHAGRLDWAYRAYHGFLEQLSPDLQEHFVQGAGRHEPYVVVFGRSQVGKTTLLLELMGVADAAQTRVGEVLRGGRGHGESATATTMEYRRSPDKYWHLDQDGDRRLLPGDVEMVEALGDVRKAMHARQLHVDAPVVVWIPSDCFNDAADARSGVRMLDLPGDNAADEQERKHVREMAQRYVPHADLILLVGRGDSLSFLLPEALTLPGIDDWQLLPNRFRIVTTYSYTANSIQQSARSFDGELTEDVFRSRLLEQIGTFGPKLSAEAADIRRYFPLELGRSWREMAKTNNELARRVDPVLKRLKAQLHDDIQASATESARFRNACDVHILAMRKREECLKAGRSTLRKLCKKMRKERGLAELARDRRVQAEKRMDAERAILDERDAAEASLQAIGLGQWEGMKRFDDLPKNTGALFEVMSDVTSWLRWRFLELKPGTYADGAFWGNWRPDPASHMRAINQIADDAFAVLSKRMNAYVFESYIPLIWGTFKEDKTRLRRDIADAIGGVEEFARHLWISQLDERVSALEGSIRQCEQDILNMDSVVSRQSLKDEKLKSEFREAKQEMQATAQRLEQDASSGAVFVRMLCEEYLVELQRRTRKIAEAPTPVEAWLALADAKAMIEERQKITASKS